jgi:putative acetyltransferase
MRISIRKFTADDAKATARLFFDSVRNGTAAYYGEAQREAWAPSVPEIEQWRVRLLAMSTFVAEEDARIAGFMTLEPDGHIDLAYVRADLIGRGVGRKMYASVLKEALATEISRLYSEVSESARPFFERQGWTLLETQTVTRNGVALTNHRMEKRLG